MNKQSFRERIDFEMRDVQLTPERIRRIHKLTDRRAPARRLPQRLPAAVLSLALAACAALVFLSRADIFGLIISRGSDENPLAEGGVTANPTETGVPLPSAAPSFEAAGLRFLPGVAVNEDGRLVLFWQVVSEREDQALFAFKDFSVQGTAVGSPDLPQTLNGLEGLTALGGQVDGRDIPTARSFSAEVSVGSRMEALAVSMTMAVYVPTAQPQAGLETPEWVQDVVSSETWHRINNWMYGAFPDTTIPPVLKATSEPTPPILTATETPETNTASSGDWEADGRGNEAYDDYMEALLRLKAGEIDEEKLVDVARAAQRAHCMDAIEDNRLVLLPDGTVASCYVETMRDVISEEDRGPDDAQASLALAERCGVIRLVGEVRIEFTVPPAG